MKSVIAEVTARCLQLRLGNGDIHAVQLRIESNTDTDTLGTDLMAALDLYEAAQGITADVEIDGGRKLECPKAMVRVIRSGLPYVAGLDSDGRRKMLAVMAANLELLTTVGQ
jgi:hypothetical protein